LFLPVKAARHCHKCTNQSLYRFVVRFEA
jgi:hypothetical protein